jgi:hypothetical protein
VKRWSLACETSVGPPRKERRHPSDRAQPKGQAREELQPRATMAVVSGVRLIARLCSQIVSIAEVDRPRVARNAPANSR